MQNKIHHHCKDSATQSKQQQIQVIVKTITQQTTSISVKPSIPISILKSKIYFQISKCLPSEKMALFMGNEQLTEPKTLKDYIKKQTKSVKIHQRKIDIQKIKGLSNFTQDQVHCDIATQMPCGHSIGAAGIVSLIKFTIQKKQESVIRCPQCRQIWNFDLCSKIGVLTSQEEKKFKKQLEAISTNKISTNCPKCNQTIKKTTQSSQIMICTSCFYGYFCFNCLEQWKASDLMICGNPQCKTGTKQFRRLLQQSPKQAKFRLKKKDTQYILLQLPKYRGCPICGNIIQHNGGCKHMACPDCKNSFCWVCLGIKQDSSWLCGSYDTLCQSVAQIQKFDSLPKKNKK